jgi:hypothetical protein
MKIIKPGKHTLWWVGIVLCCPTCGQEVMLETGDQWEAEWYPHQDAGTVNVQCQCCTTMLTATATPSLKP